MLSAKLIAPEICDSFTEGYDWIVESIKSSEHSDISSELEISKALQYLKEKDFAQVFRIISYFRLLNNLNLLKTRIRS